jgi:hypothetical protein
MTAGRNGTLGTCWRGAFHHCSLWYKKNFNFLTSFQKRPTKDMAIHRETQGKFLKASIEEGQ